ncbi:hypothetical protein [Paraburkholderia phytofirmans]|uniref:Lipoprotein n=1 Tax=Paraburkholderia phytofirmans (strain DSM 17436 / LMG 22146 / PsJN) TaxID=398527 RepID=B2T9R2_PARPJ|nr:hypothetical protein [Paraburkholderia phytofirmans]ACD21164.1 conserved hypothetical protein [Paraburkholderia phytofirmans PsJN]
MKPLDFLFTGACLAGALLATTINAVAGNACNKTPVQPESVMVVGQDMIVNGVPTSVVGMQFPGSAKSVSNAFRDFWTREDVPAKGRSDSSGMLLSALDDQCLYILSIPPQPESDHTRGLMSIVRLGGDKADHKITDSAVPLPQDSTILSDVESNDSGQTGRTWVLDMPGDAQWNAQRYRNILATRGWVDVGRQPDYQATGNRAAQGTAFAMQHGKDSLDVSFSDNSGRTAAVVNAIRNR